jgi:hypothetical protein
MKKYSKRYNTLPLESDKDRKKVEVQVIIIETFKNL